MRSVVEEVVDAKLSKASKMPSELAEMILLLSKEVCGILIISPSRYMNFKKIKSWLDSKSSGEGILPGPT